MRYIFAGLFVIYTSLVSCTLIKPSCAQKNENTPIPNDSAQVIYSDSVDSIILNADKIRIYDMVDFVAPRDSINGRDSIFKYEIKKDVGFLKKVEKEILSFIVSDRDWYIRNYAPVRQPFHPNITLEFITKKKSVFMLISFGTEEVAIVDKVGQFKFYQMRNKRQMARWASMIFPDEEYYKELIKLQ